MQCPHCLVAFHDEVEQTLLGTDVDGDWGILSSRCPSCERLIFRLVKGDLFRQPGVSRRTLGALTVDVLIRPRGSTRNPVPPEVSEEFSEDYREACLILVDSPKASAALSRRCLQHILREKAKVKHGTLYDEIQEVLNRKSLPSDIADSLDLVRKIGNIAAHSTKSQSTGEIVPVETGEAEWCLDVIEMLYDFYLVRPESNRKRLEAINEKLADASKAP